MIFSANRIAWLVLGFVALSVAGFAVFLLFPSGGDGTDQASNTAQADAPPDGWSALAQPATATPGAASLPPRRVERTGIVDHVSGHALSIQTTGRGLQRVLLQTSAQVIRVHTLPGLSTVSAGDTVIVSTGVLLRDAFKPPEDTGRVWRIVILADTPLPDLSPSCPAVGGRIGTVVAVAPGSLHLQTACGERLLEVLPTVQVQRRARADITDLAIDQRITVNGELLPDGTVSGVFVQILDL